MSGKLGIQSYCFRTVKDNARVAECIKTCGLSRVELCGVHVDFGNPASCDAALAAYADAGIKIVSIGVERMGSDEARERERFEFLKRCGASLMSVDFDLGTTPACYRLTERLCAEYNVRVGIHNHGGQHWLGSAAMLEHVFGMTNDSIGLILDTAWALDSRLDPVAMAGQFAERLYGVHIKDFVFDRASRPQDVIVGEGNLDLTGLAGVLRAQAFSGELIIEFEGDPGHPLPALQQCVAKVKAAFQL
jgi:inosose dehydratase